MLQFSDPDSKVHRANMGPIWGRQDPDGPHVGPINFAIWASNVAYFLDIHNSNHGMVLFVVKQLL